MDVTDRLVVAVGGDPKGLDDAFDKAIRKTLEAKGATGAAADAIQKSLDSLNTSKFTDVLQRTAKLQDDLALARQGGDAKSAASASQALRIQQQIQRALSERLQLELSIARSAGDTTKIAALTQEVRLEQQLASLSRAGITGTAGFGLAQQSVGALAEAEVGSKAASVSKALDNIVDRSRFAVLDAGSAKIRIFGSALEDLAAVGLVTAAAIAAVGGAVAGASRAAEWADQLESASKRLGIGVADLQAWQHAFTLSNVSVEQGEDALQAFNAAFGRLQSGAAKGALAKYGALVFTPDQLKSLHDASDALPVLATRMESFGTTTKAAIEKAFGIESLAPLINQGGDAMAHLLTQAHALGLVIDESLVKKAAEASDQLKITHEVISAELTTALAELTPALASIATGFAEATTGAVKFGSAVADDVGVISRLIDRATGIAGALEASGAKDGDSFAKGFGQALTERLKSVLPPWLQLALPLLSYAKDAALATGREQDLAAGTASIGRGTGKYQESDQAARNGYQPPAGWVKHTTPAGPAGPGVPYYTPPAPEAPPNLATPKPDHSKTVEDSAARAKATALAASLAAQVQAASDQLDLDKDNLAGLDRINADIDARTALELQRLNAERDAKDAELKGQADKAAADKTISDAARRQALSDIDAAKKAEDAASSEQALAVARKAAAEKAAAFLASLQRSYDAQNRAAQTDDQIASIRVSMANTLDDQRTLALQQLADQHQQATREIGQKFIAGGMSITDYYQQLDNEDRLSAAKQSQLSRQYADPVDKYLASIKDLNTEIEDDGIEAFKSLSDSIGQSAAQALGLKGALGQFFSALISQLVQHETGSLAGSLITGFAGLFGGGAGLPTIGWSGGSIVNPVGGGLLNTSLPHFAGGTRYAPGGMAIVGEHGPEAINLPQGSQVFPAGITAGLLGAMDTANGVRGRPMTVTLHQTIDLTGANGDATIRKIAVDAATSAAQAAFSLSRQQIPQDLARRAGRRLGLR